MLVAQHDVAWPVFADVKLAIDDVLAHPGKVSRGAPVSAGAVAHQLVTAALASSDYQRAQHVARLARELLPGDQAVVLDLARVLDAQGQVEQARAVLDSFTHRAGKGRSQMKESDQDG